MIPFISSFETINVDIADPKSFFANIAAVNANGTKTLSANGFRTFFIKGKSVFNNGHRSLPKNPPDCPILCK